MGCVNLLLQGVLWLLRMEKPSSTSLYPVAYSKCDIFLSILGSWGTLIIGGTSMHGFGPRELVQEILVQRVAVG